MGAAEKTRTRGTEVRTPLRYSLTVAGLSFAVYVLHSLFFMDWIVDDAGITFVYARNLAAGHGLVSQPGAPPVEGYSNFTWLIIFVPFFLVNAFHVYIVPKVVSAFFVLFTFVAADRSLRRFEESSDFLILSILCLVSLNSSFVVWTSSGLENPLYVFLAVCLFIVCLDAIRPGELPEGRAVIAGILCALLGLTRPDGVLYLAVLPTLMFLFYNRDGVLPGRNFWKGMAVFVLVFIALYGSYIVFRVLYFKDLFPNPYYAKGGPQLMDAVNIHLLRGGKGEEVGSLAWALGGYAGPLVMLLPVIFSVMLLLKKRFDRIMVAAFLFLYISAMDHLLLPPDYMGLHRYATPFFLFFYLFLGVSFVRTAESYIGNSGTRKAVTAASAILLVLFSAFIFMERSYKYSLGPSTPFSRIRQAYGVTINRYADMLEIEDGSLLAPDMGGTLYESDLRVYDLGMLCDRTIARTLNKEQDRFYDYVFEEIKPTFIMTHKAWTHRARFQNDLRFKRDYVPVFQFIDPDVIKVKGVKMYSGLYVKREAVEGKEKTLQKIREEIRRAREGGD